MCDYVTQYNQKAKEGMRFIPIVLKAFKILQDLRKKEDERRFYKLNIGDVLFISLDIFDKILNDKRGEFLKELQEGDMEGLLKIKDQSIDKYLTNYEDVLKMSIDLSNLENVFKEEI